MIGSQIVIVFVGGQSFSVVRMSGSQWAYSVVLGFLSIPVGYLIRQVPDGPIEAIVERSRRFLSKLRFVRYRRRNHNMP